MEKKWQVRDLSELENVAKELKEILLKESQNRAIVLGLKGELGAGKTTLVQLLAKEIEIKDQVNSPTFVIEKRYQSGQIELIHIDAYRIESEAEMLVLNFSELLSQPNTIICIEWAERIATLLPTYTKWLEIELSGDVRNIIYVDSEK